MIMRISLYIFGEDFFFFPNYAADSHWHDDVEFIVVLSGRMLYNVNGVIVPLEEGEGIFVNSKQLHHGFSIDHTECDFICMLFHPMVICTSNQFEQEYIIPILKNNRPFIHLSLKICWQKHILAILQDIYKAKEIPTAPLYIQGLLCLLWNEMISNNPSLKPQTKDNRLTILKHMISYIHTHYQEKITLNEIASAGHVSKRTCGTIFQEYQNQTPITFLIHYRLRKSIELMTYTDMSILEISFAVGFSNASYYAETFRKFFGKGPREYRNILFNGAPDTK